MLVYYCTKKSTPPNMYSACLKTTVKRTALKPIIFDTPQLLKVDNLTYQFITKTAESDH